ncbi:hypothetical protein H0O00_02795 [Candidatus Micrarchaeota archaeon]|nr:hypothetical protein [Candidatus Micrarchaeota archaeon]
MNDCMMREISLDEAKQIWDRFVPEKQVWTDDWDMRVAICKEFGYKPLILYDGRNFFPLQYEPENRFYTIISGATAEKNYLTFDPEFMKKTKEIPENIYFDFLAERFDGCVDALCPQFFIDLTGIDSIDDYLERFSAKHQKNFRRSCRQFGNYEFLRQGTLKEMAELNMETFGQESDFVNDEMGCYAILDKDPRTEYWSIVKDGKNALITQYFFYGRTMSVCSWGVGGGYDETMKIALAEAIKLAKSRGCTRIDYAPTYSSWKFLYRLDTAPLWRYKRGSIPSSVETPGYEIPLDERERLRAEGRL